MYMKSLCFSFVAGIAGVLVLIVIIVVVVIVVWRKKFTSKKVHFRASSESQVYNIYMSMNE